MRRDAIRPELTHARATRRRGHYPMRPGSIAEILAGMVLVFAALAILGLIGSIVAGAIGALG